MGVLRIPAGDRDDEAVHLVEWLLEDGVRVETGDGIYSIERDKAVIEIPAEENGTLRILDQAGRSFAPGHIIGMIS